MKKTAEYPVLETERLLLRKLTYDDIDAAFKLFSDPEVTKYEDAYPTKNAAEIKEIIDWGNGLIEHNVGGIWGVFNKKNGKFLGDVNYVARPDNNFTRNVHRAEIGYHLCPECWGKGYVSEALKSVIPYVFTKTTIDRIEALIHPENSRSHNVVLRAGFLKEGVLRNYVLWEGKHQDRAFYSLLKNDREANL